MQRPAIAGDRQTCDRGIHPTLGPGWAVYDNGPSYFVPDGGEPVAMKIGLGGAGQGASWRSCPDGKIDTTGQPRGEQHRRRWHPVHGEGWLVQMPVDRGSRFCRERFEPDSGGPSFQFDWVVARVGRGGKEPRRPKPGQQKSPELVEWEAWWKFETKDGEVFVFRKEPPPERVEAPAAPTQASLFDTAGSGREGL